MLNVLNTVFREAGIDWDVFITKDAGDAERLAREAAEAGVDAVVVYGGDGTVTEAAAGLVGTEVPLAILPGGTANAIALALGIPTDLEAAAALLARNTATPAMSSSRPSRRSGAAARIVSAIASRVPAIICDEKTPGAIAFAVTC